MKRKAYLANFSRLRPTVYFDPAFFEVPEKQFIAVAIGKPEMGATFLPHLTAKDHAAFRGTHIPTTGPKGNPVEIQLHANGSLTGVEYLDLAWFLGGKGKEAIWIGTLEEAKRQQLVRAIIVCFRCRPCAMGYIPASLKKSILPDRIATRILTTSGRIEIHAKINDARNATMFDKVTAWFEL